VNKTTWRDIEKEGWWGSFLKMKRTEKSTLHGSFIPDVARYFLLRHTQPGQWVWDPFSGSGTTLFEAEKLGRQALATDLTPARPCIQKADALNLTILTDAGGKPAINDEIIPDEWIEEHDEELFLFDLVICHPPYGTTISFSEDERDLSNASNLDRYTEMLYKATVNIARHVKPGGYMCWIMGDIWSNNNTGLVPLAFLTMDMAMDLLPGARLKSIAVKDIVGNQAARHNRNLKLSRLFRWGANELAHETLFSIQRGLKT
jgi:DNA modification methylase